MKVLIAEDDATSRVVLAKVLHRFGYEVVAACDGLEAWNLLQQPDAPQIAILDWAMPGLDGPEVCRRLRARKQPPILYVLLVTSRNNTEDIVAGLGSGADDFMSKPWNPAELQARIEVGHRVVELQNRLKANVTELGNALAQTRRLMEDQNLSIDLARKLLNLTNRGTPSWIPLNDDTTLHLATLSLSCARAGGDHFWARTSRAPESNATVTTIGIRDQSGHEVNCILRSIASDLMHMEELGKHATLENQMAKVNDRICGSGMFAEDDFLTALTLQLDHASLRLRYVNCGHPPMLLIRGSSVQPLPARAGPGRNVPLGSLPGQAFEAGETQLRAGDRLLLYTDGLADLRKPECGRGWSNDELAELVASLLHEAPDLPVRELIQRLFAVASGTSARPNGTNSLPDDVTLLGLEIESDNEGSATCLHLQGLGELDRAVKILSENILSDWKIQHSIPRLRLFLDEAITNAWLHGNHENASLPIQVRWRRHNGYAIQVEDRGNGFDPDQIIDPLSPEGLLQEHGRGVFIIRSLCDWAHWKKNGTRLVARWTEAPPHAER